MSTRHDLLNVTSTVKISLGKLFFIKRFLPSLSLTRHNTCWRGRSFVRSQTKLTLFKRIVFLKVFCVAYQVKLHKNTFQNKTHVAGKMIKGFSEKSSTAEWERHSTQATLTADESFTPWLQFSNNWYTLVLYSFLLLSYLVFFFHFQLNSYRFLCRIFELDAAMK